MDLLSLLYAYGPLFLFFILLLDSLGLPLPTEVSLLLAGGLVARGDLPGPITLAAALAGSVIGCAISYRLGAVAGMKWVSKAAWRVGIGAEKLARTQAWLEKNTSYGVCLGRFVPFVRCLVGYPAGMVGMPFGRYMALSVLGYAGWISASAGAGYFLGDQWYLVVKYTEETLLIAGIAAVIYIAIRRLRVRRQLHGK